MTYIDPNAKTMTPEEVSAWHDKRRADIAARKAASPSRRLAALTVGESYTFAKYRTTQQVSGSIRQTAASTGRRFTSRIARDLVTGESVIGVTVTRVS